MKRVEARELAFKTIYSNFFNKTEEDVFVGADDEGLKFTKQILENFAKHFTEVNETIAANIKGYTIDRLNKVDLAILVVAIVELKYIAENPKEVVINEAVELAKKYSTEKSPKFINGVLASIVK